MARRVRDVPFERIRASLLPVLTVSLSHIATTATVTRAVLPVHGTFIAAAARVGFGALVGFFHHRALGSSRIAGHHWALAGLATFAADRFRSVRGALVIAAGTRVCLGLPIILHCRCTTALQAEDRGGRQDHQNRQDRLLPHTAPRTLQALITLWRAQEQKSVTPVTLLDVLHC